MYQVEYTRLALLGDGKPGNVSQGDDVSYMDCEIEHIEAMLRNELNREERTHKYYPVVNKITKIKGHIVNQQCNKRK